jgi:hypothetical protein
MQPGFSARGCCEYNAECQDNPHNCVWHDHASLFAKPCPMPDGQVNLVCRILVNRSDGLRKTLVPQQRQNEMIVVVHNHKTTQCNKTVFNHSFERIDDDRSGNFRIQNSTFLIQDTLGHKIGTILLREAALAQIGLMRFFNHIFFNKCIRWSRPQRRPSRHGS